MNRPEASSVPRPYGLAAVGRGLRTLASARIVLRDNFNNVQTEREEELERALAGALLSGTESARSPGAVVAIGLNWYLRNLPQAPLVVAVPKGDGTYEFEHEHPLVRLFRRPNSSMDQQLFDRQWRRDYLVTGECYLGTGVGIDGADPRSLSWLPQARMHAEIDRATGVTLFYRYTRADGTTQRLEFDQVAHFRWAMDEDWRAISPLEGVTPERATDREASRMVATILHNLGMPGGILSRRAPRAGELPLKPFDPDRVEKRFDRRFGGGGRGRVLVENDTLEFQKIAWSPDELAVPGLQHVSEERISACMGLDAVVLSLGAGLEHGTYNNQETARRKAWEGGATPINFALASAIEHRLLPLFDDRPGVMVAHDYSKVPALIEDQDQLAARAVKLTGSGLWSVEEGRVLTGKEAEFDPTHRRIIPSMQMEVDASGMLLDETPAERSAAAARAGSNGATGTAT